jgi:hypothetical protein
MLRYRMLNIFIVYHIATHGKPYLGDHGTLQDLVEVSATSWVTVFLQNTKRCQAQRMTHKR